MAIRVALSHRTTYRFDRHVAPRTARDPAAAGAALPDADPRLLADVEPESHFLNWQQDPYGNWVARLVFPERADRLEIEVDLVADMTVINPFDFFVEAYAEHFPFTYAPALAKELDPVPRDRAARRRALPPGSTTSARRSRPARTRSTCWSAQPAAAGARSATWCAWSPACRRPKTRWSRRSGSLPRLGLAAGADPAPPGLAARFASGYLIQLVADVSRSTARRAPTAISPTCTRGPRSICPARAGSASIPPRACSPARATFRSPARRDPGNAAPVIGYTDVCEVEFDFAMQRDPRSRRSARHQAVHATTQWAGDRRARRAGRRDLARHDVRLTQGGEPTFVSIDDMDGPEWNYTALSPKKRELAEKLLQRLKRASPPAACCTTGRASGTRASRCRAGRSGVFWRTDGEPLWRDAALVADTTRRARRRRCRRARSASGSPQRLGLPASLRDHRVRGRAEAARRPRRHCRPTSIRCRPT